MSRHRSASMRTIRMLRSASASESSFISMSAARASTSTHGIGSPSPSSTRSARCTRSWKSRLVSAERKK
ncbi:hypothetical protein [Saccharopolyspora gregorii]|uniref:hypothetical protein n=1 Tax=Saccharopolyspora gregorii TaxID=33914 RepID=UPI0031EA5E09